MAGPEDEPMGEVRGEERGEERTEERGEKRGRLPSFTDVNLSIGQFLAGLEQRILHNRPPAVVVMEQEARGERVTTGGLIVDNLPTEPLDRPEPPDTSGAKL